MDKPDKEWMALIKVVDRVRVGVVQVASHLALDLEDTLRNILRTTPGEAQIALALALSAAKWHPYRVKDIGLGDLHSPRDCGCCVLYWDTEDEDCCPLAAIGRDGCGCACITTEYGSYRGKQDVFDYIMDRYREHYARVPAKYRGEKDND